MSWLTVHFDEQTIAALDAAAAEITAHYPTLKVSREDIVRSLVARGIEAPRKSAPQPIAPVVAPPQPAPVEDRRPITSTDQPHGLRTLDERMRWLRRCANLSQRAVDRAAGVRRGVAWALENEGDSHSMEMLDPVAKLFDVSLDWLLRGVGTVPSPRAIAVGVASRRKDTEVSR